MPNRPKPCDTCNLEILKSGAQLYSTIPSEHALKQSAIGPLKGIQAWFAICRKNIYWVEPYFGKNDSASIPDECQFLLWKNKQGLFQVAIPLCDGDYRSVLCGHDDAPLIKWDNGLKQQSPESIRVLYTRSGKHAHALVHAAMQEISLILGSFQMREDKTTPDFIDYLGWCTWDAFYQTVDQEKVRAGLESFRAGGVQLGHMILDDGMLDHNEQLLNSFTADTQKFPQGLKTIAQMAKEEFKLHSFGVWHAFQGYWRGVDPKGELGQDYKTIKNKGKIRPWEGADQFVELSMVEPNDIHRFYFDFYRHLKSQGVDMTKVDNQSALERYSHHKRGRGLSMRNYQEAFQAAGKHFFNGNILHCMSNGSDVGMNMLSSNAYRNSDDYFPKKDSTAQQHHVCINAFNATLTSTFSFPDWDMFQTHSPCPEFHAAARAISGGPVYVCDYPEKQNFKILKKLALDDGRVLRSAEPALVCEDTLFTNVEQEAKALKLYNRNEDIIVLGIFHCNHSDIQIETQFSVSDHPLAVDADYACYRHEQQSLSVHTHTELQSCNLGHAQHELIHCSPIADGVAALGLLDKYNGSAAIEVHGWAHDGYLCALHAGSNRIGFYSEKKPKQVLVDGKAKDFTFKDHLLIVKASSKRGVDIILKF